MIMQRVSDWREPCVACMEGAEGHARIRGEEGRTEVSGIINLDKPRGPTSHDVVDRIRSASGVRRVGHAGTLDPAASGVLLVCVGQATRVTEFLMEGRKRYDALLRLGITTATGDTEGKAIRMAPAGDVSQEQIVSALHSFQGRIKQVPPMYSALKHRGKALYHLARQGVEIARRPREVEIYDLQLAEWEPPLTRLLVECSKGTYIRALARDLGEELGTGAHLERLTRLSSGRFRLEDSVSLPEAEVCLSSDRGREIMHPLDEALLDFEAFKLDEDAAARARQGQQVQGPQPQSGPLARAYGPDGSLIALLQYDERNQVWQPRKVFKPHGAAA
jgi:tRNA pseudouridine55 synthase